MSSSYKSLRAYWFPASLPEGRFVIATATSFNLTAGLDIPDITPFISHNEPVFTNRVLVTTSEGFATDFAVFYTGAPNGHLRNPSVFLGGCVWSGDFVVFRMRKADSTCSLVNMRKRDDKYAIQAVSECVTIWYLLSVMADRLE